MSTVYIDLQQEIDDCQFDHILGQIEQDWPLRDQVAKALKHANAVFSKQCTKPNGYTYMQACDNLVDFLDLKIKLEYTEQESVVDVLQVACAMHENAVNNPSLTETQRMDHHLAITSLVPLLKSTLEGIVTHPDLRREVATLTGRAENALVRALDAMDVSRFIGWDNTPLAESGNASLTVPRPIPPRESVPDSPSYDCLDSLVSKLKQKALAMMKDHARKVPQLPPPKSQPYRKPAPLERRHTMPALSRTAFNPYPSWKTTGRTSSKALRGLHALQESEDSE